MSCSEPPQGHGPAPASSIADILRAVCREVADAGQSACDLQTALSGLAPAPGQQGRAIEALQALDLLTQQLGGVAAFLDALAPTLPTSWVGDATAATAAVTMSDLARRLGRPHGDHCRTASEDAGALEMF